MISEFPIGDTITTSAPPVGEERARLFRLATASTHSPSFIPSLATLFRDAEFKWLDRMSVDWHKLLHSEQEYEYFSELPYDSPITVATTLKNVRVRKSMTFVELETKISSKTHHVTSHTYFVLRDSP